MNEAKSLVITTISVADTTHDPRMLERAAGMVVMAYNLRAIGKNDLLELNREIMKRRTLCKWGKHEKEHG